jgi:hypothetical protein
LQFKGDSIMIRNIHLRGLTRTVFVAVLAVSAAGVQAQENYSLWSGSRNYSLNTSATGASVAGSVTNFPVLVRLGASDSAIFAAAKTDGADIRFSKANGTRLPHQIEFWNAASRSAAIWVKADTVLGNTAMQVMRMHWGKADAADSSNGAAVFSTGNGFVGVWHMGGAADVTDATGSGLTAVGPGGSIPGAVTAGVAGAARSFDGATQYFNVTHDERLNVTAAITMSLWVNASNWNGSTRLLQKSGAAENNAGQYGMRDDSQNQLALNINGIHTNTGSLAPVPTTGEWHLIHGTFDGSTVIQYQDGDAVATGSTAGPIATGTGDLQIARRPDGTGYLTGMMDEVRIHGVARSADWARLEFENQKSGQTLLQLASEVSIRSDLARRAGASALRVRTLVSGMAFLLPATEKGANGTTNVSLTDLQGRTLWSRSVSAGTQELVWNGMDRNGRAVSAGLYFVQAQTVDASGKTLGSSFARISYAP